MFISLLIKIPPEYKEALTRLKEQEGGTVLSHIREALRQYLETKGITF